MNIKTQKIYSDIQKAVADSRSVLIVSHSAPDGDSVGSQLAFRNYVLELGKDVEVINEGQVPGIYRNLPDVGTIGNIDHFSTEIRFDLVVMLDCSIPERVGTVKKLINDNVPIINIDHHPDNTGFGTVNLINEASSSTAELLTEYFLAINFTIDKNCASLLYTGILTDTGRFRFESTGRRTMELVGALIECGADPRRICDDIYYSVSPSVFKMTGKMLEGAEFYENGKICLLEISQKSIKKYNASFSDLDGLADFALHAENVMIGALLKELDNKKVKVSLRSKNAINVSKVAHYFGGGGHRNASGFVMNSLMDKDRQKLLDNLKGLLNASV